MLSPKGGSGPKASEGLAELRADANNGGHAPAAGGARHAAHLALPYKID